MDARTIASVLEGGGFRLVVVNAAAVIGERPIAGVAHSFRAVIAQGNADGTWRITVLRKLPARRHGRAYDYLPLLDGTGQLLRRECRDELEVGLFVGGAVSVPVHPDEVVAIRRGEMAVVA